MQKKQTILVVASLLVVVLSVTLAYFTAQIIGKGKDISVSSADLKIIFTDTDGNIEGNDITPGWSNSKTFTVKNESNETYKYNIVIKDLVNTFVTKGYLQYKITSTNGGYNMTEFEDVPKSETATDTILAYSASIDVGVTQSYTVEFIYKNDESVDQSEDMGKTLSGTLYIEKGTEKPFNGGTLVEAIKYYNPTIKTRTDFSSVFTETNTGTLYKATESIASDTPKDVYYFAGDAKNNWVKFGKYADDEIRGYINQYSTKFKKYTTLEECNSASSYNTNCSYAWRKGDPMYWRIIRTNHDGSIRLLYHGTSTTATDAYIGQSVINAENNDPMYVGYKYGTTGSLENNRLNTNDSTIKTYVDNWYKNYLTAYTKYLSNDAVYCNDRNLASGQTYSTTNRFTYAPYGRLYTNNTPTYNCTNNKDAFSGNNSEAKLTYPIGLMTADEVVFAGGVYGSNAKTWYYYNSANGNSAGSTWELMSPYFWEDSLACMFGVMGSTFPGFLSNGRVGLPSNVRPALSLKACIKYSTGNGTPETPYEIVETDTGC
jgi:hypothetical protein